MFLIWAKGPDCEGIKYKDIVLEKSKCTFFTERPIKNTKPAQCLCDWEKFVCKQKKDIKCVKFSFSKFQG